MEIKVKKIHPDAVIPEFAHSTDTGFDLYACEDTVVEGKGKAIVKTGLIFELPEGWGIQIRNKSGITVKGCPIQVKTPKIKYTEDNEFYIDYEYKTERVDLTVYIGTVDNAYRGEIGIMVKNESLREITIPKHTKLAQGVLEQVFHCDFVVVEDVNNTDRGSGGFGSTGTNK